MRKFLEFLPVAGRLLLCSLFIWAGYAKLVNPGGTTRDFVAAGVPAAALMVWVAIVIELVGGLCLLVGFQARWVGLALAVWSLITGFAVHLSAGLHSPDAMVAYDNMIHFYKNLGLAGGMLYLAAFGAGPLSIDNLAGHRSK
jgi:putative oxidoreductase